MDRATLVMAMSAMADRKAVAAEVAKRLNLTTTTLYTYFNGDGTPKAAGQAVLDGTHRTLRRPRHDTVRTLRPARHAERWRHPGRGACRPVVSPAGATGPPSRAECPDGIHGAALRRQSGDTVSRATGRAAA